MAVLRISRLWPSLKGRQAANAIDAVGLDAFSSEAGMRVGSHLTPVRATRADRDGGSKRGGRRKVGLVLATILVAAAIAGGAYYVRLHPITLPEAPGSIAFETAPAGIDVVVAGKSVGKTPVRVSLPAGSYAVRLGSGDSAHTFTVAVASGTSIVQHYEIVPAAASAPPVNGSLRVQTEPAHQAILVDGVERGPSPLSLDVIAAGDHEIAIRTEKGAIKRTVHVAAGQTTSVILASAQPAGEAAVVTAGWLAVTTPIPLQVHEEGRLLGATDVENLMMSSGNHTIDLVNDTFGFRTQRTVKIVAGKTATIRIEVPNGNISLNALPWADVFVDGERVGQTPIGNLSRPIGRHEVVFRHPTLGERRESVNVTTLQTTRLGVDLRK